MATAEAAGPMAEQITRVPPAAPAISWGHHIEPGARRRTETTENGGCREGRVSKGNRKTKTDTGQTQDADGEERGANHKTQRSEGTLRTPPITRRENDGP